MPGLCDWAVGCEAVRLEGLLFIVTSGGHYRRTAVMLLFVMASVGYVGWSYD